MSDLLNSASLVVIPSGYKEDTVYSVVPTDGSGDLSFTRASNGTRVNSAGLVEVVSWNLFDYSEGFNASYWNKRSGTTITADTTTAPNGTLTADTATLTSGDGYIWADLTLLPSTTYTISLYAKGSANLYFNAYWGTGSSTGSIITLTSDWQRLSFSFTTGSTTSLGDFGFLISATCNIYGAQLNIGSTAKPYFPTTDRLNVPRLTYQNGGGGCPSLLLEKQSTNFQTYSQDFRNIAEGGASNTWTPNDTLILSTNNTAPDGTLTATRIRGNGSNRARQAVIFGTMGSTYSGSIFIRRVSGSSTIELRVGDVSQVSTINPTSSWQRFTHTASPTSTAIRLAVVFSNNTDEFEIWGAQLEESSYATSYIPTTSASATRVADACFKTGISSLIGQTEGVVFFDFTVDTISAQTNNPVLWYMKDGGAGERYFELYSNGNLEYVEFDGTTVIASIIKTGLTVGRHKCAIGYANNDMVLYVDGVRIGTDVSGTPNGFSTFSLQYYNSSFFGQQKVNQCAIFKTRLTNAELASLTTI